MSARVQTPRWWLLLAASALLGSLLRSRREAGALPAVAVPRPAPVLVAPVERARPRARVLGAAAGWLTAVVPLVLWWSSLDAIDLDRIGPYGLASGMPAPWYAALALVLAGAVRTLFAPRLCGLLVAAHVAVAVLVIYATVPAVADVPQYAWTYKHIGVTQSIEAAGSIGPLVDIYHRWPGFFALAAAFSRLSGLPDPMSYAAWAEPMFALLGALLVAAIARTLSGDARVAGLAALFSVVSAWVAQNYFAPQPLAFLLGLTLMLVLLRWVMPAPRWPRLLLRAVGDAAVRPAPAWGRRATPAVVVALDAVIVVTHQLTPYMLLLGLATLAVFGVLRLVRLVVLALALPAAYLLLHLSYIQESFPLFAGLNPGANWRARAYETTEPWLVGHAGGLVSACMGLLALFAVAALLRKRTGPWPLVVLGLALAPGLTVLGVAYGGEASLRVHLFAAPWLAVLAAWGLATLPSPNWRRAGSAAGLTVVTALFAIAFFGRTELNVMARDEVQASAHFYAHAPRNSLLVLVNPGFPTRLAARYASMPSPDGGDRSPNLMARQNAGEVRGGSVAAVRVTLRQLGGRGSRVRPYVVFSGSQARYAAVNRILSRAETRRLERAVAGSPAFRLWHRTANARIYEAVAG